MEKLELVKTDKLYYSAKKKPDVRVFSKLEFLTLVGQGAPAGKAFTKAVEALYPLAYGIKKIYKLKEMDFTVPKLEGLWWVDGDKPALDIPRELWHWKLMIRMPKYVKRSSVQEAKAIVLHKKGIELVEDIKFESMTEGKCVQIMHLGPYSAEPETIRRMTDFIHENGLKENGLHHEIYLSDPRRTAPEKMKTILRQPVK